MGESKHGLRARLGGIRERLLGTRDERVARALAKQRSHAGKHLDAETEALKDLSSRQRPGAM